MNLTNDQIKILHSLLNLSMATWSDGNLEDDIVRQARDRHDYEIKDFDFEDFITLSNVLSDGISSRDFRNRKVMKMLRKIKATDEKKLSKDEMTDIVAEKRVDTVSREERHQVMNWLYGEGHGDTPIFWNEDDDPRINCNCNKCVLYQEK